MTTAKLLLPEITGSQAQKHVTHNEALFYLDQIVQMTVIDKDLSTPPVSPTNGDAYIVGAVATGDWASHEGDLAMYDTGWVFRTPQAGWSTWVEDENTTYRYMGGEWLPDLGSLTVNGASTVLRTTEELISGMTGASVATTIVIPDRCILLGVSTRTTTEITGASSYDCGPTGGSASAYGGSLGIAAGSTNIGVIGPAAFYADTTVTLTANGSDFTAGAVRVTIHYMDFTAPAS